MKGVPGVILAGGLATRMGGGDKCLLDIGGKPLLRHLAERLGPQCAALALNANGDPSRFGDIGIPIIADSLPDHAGPLAGILAGLDWAAGLGARAIVTAAADTPFIPLDLVARLKAVEAETGASVVLAASADQDGIPRVHPTFGLWPVSLRDDLRSALSNGMRKVRLWADRHQAETAQFPSAPFDPFFNINTRGDLARARMLAATAG